MPPARRCTIEFWVRGATAGGSLPASVPPDRRSALCRQHRGHVLDGPAPDTFQQIDQRASRRRQRGLDLRRHCRVHLTLHEPISLQPSQHLRQHLLRDATRVPAAAHQTAWCFGTSRNPASAETITAVEMLHAVGPPSLQARRRKHPTLPTRAGASDASRTRVFSDGRVDLPCRVGCPSCEIVWPVRTEDDNCARSIGLWRR